METNIHFLLNLVQFLLEWEMFQTKVAEKFNTHFVFNNLFFENRAVYEIMWKKYCRAGQNTGSNMAQAHCMLDN